jgi:hypothetical protein
MCPQEAADAPRHPKDQGTGRSAERPVRATENAVAAGYTGFRAVVDVTAVVRSAEQREAFARFEYLIDRKMSVLPVSALCAYDVRAIGTRAATELACLHPFANLGSTSFHLFADTDFALAGEIDHSSADVFATTLGRTVPLSSGAELTVGARGLEFVDHRTLLALSEAARRGVRTVVVDTTGYSTTRTMIEMLELTNLRVEAAP